MEVKCINCFNYIKSNSKCYLLKCWHIYCDKFKENNTWNDNIITCSICSIMTKKEEMKEMKIDYEIDICDKHQQPMNFYDKETNKLCCITCIENEIEIINKRYVQCKRNEMNKTINDINEQIEKLLKNLKK